MLPKKAAKAIDPARELAGAGWKRDASGVWRHPGSTAIDYSDGDAAEEAVLAAIEAAADRSIASAELPPPKADWPLEYHLSAARANLLRPLPIGPGSRVLELGAGCGAITRALGETGAIVIGLEGSARRAAAAAMRCRDLENVAIAYGDARTTELPGRFDWVVVIGVLEYVRNGATDPSSAEIDFLKRTSSWLEHDGVLVLAIENRLGMKYLAGCGEDHVGRAFFGVEDRYGSNGPATFGCKELDDLLAGAGHRAREFLLSFPDYKLPEVILRGDALARPAIDVAALAGGTFSRDYSGKRTRAFSESLAWRPAARNGLLADLANSFLVLASPASALPSARSPDPAVLAWAFSSGRRPAHRVETRFVRSADGVTVTKRALHPHCKDREARGPADPEFARRDLAEPFIAGWPLHELIARAISRNEDDAVVDGLVDRWLDALVASAVVDGRDAETILLPADHVDAIPANAMLTHDGRVEFFDLEWVGKQPVPLAWIVLRGLLGLAWRLDDVGRWEGRSVLDLAARALERRGLKLGDGAVRTAVSEDARLIREVLAAEGDDFAFPLTEASLSAPISPRVELMANALARAQQELRQNVDVHRQLHDLRNASDTLSEEVAHLRDLWQDEKRAHAEAIGQIHASEAQSHERGVELEAAHGQMQSLAKELIASREGSARAQWEAEQVIARLQAELAAGGSALQALEANRVELAAQLSALQELAARRAEASARELESARADAVTLQDLLDVRSVELEESRARINAQLIEIDALQKEFATFGGRLGRFVTRKRNQWLPAGSRRGRGAALAAKFVRSMANDGPVPALKRTARFARKAMASQPSSASAATDFAVTGDGRTASPAELAHWIVANEPDAARLEIQRLEATTWKVQPLLSVVLPVYRIASTILEATLVSLQRQTYERWEACVACADAADSENWALLSRLAKADNRIRPFLLDANHGISGNSNAALAAAVGEFVALLDHDDELSPSAFFDVVRTLDSSPELDFLYTDKDSIDASGGHRQHALFKPGWSPEMLHSVNYLTHLNVIRRSLLQEIGGWRPETDGAQDWDLFFRVTERSPRIARICGLHYHWRIVPTSTATGLTAKPYAAAAQLRCQRDRLERLKWAATAVPSDECGFRVIWWPPSQPNVELLVHAQGADRLRDCLDTLRFADLADVATIRVLATPQTPDYAALARDFAAVWGARVRFERSGKPLAVRLTTIAREPGPSIVALVDGRIRFVSMPAIEEVSRWVNGTYEIAWAAGIVLAKGDIVREAGRVTNADGLSAPLFRDVPLRSWGWFGGPLWHRNASAASPTLFALRREALAALDPSGAGSFAIWWSRACQRLRGTSRRGLVTPHARAWLDTELEDAPIGFDEGFRADPYFHPSFCSVSPLRLMP